MGKGNGPKKGYNVTKYLDSYDDINWGDSKKNEFVDNNIDKSKQSIEYMAEVAYMVYHETMGVDYRPWDDIRNDTNSKEFDAWVKCIKRVV